VLNEKYRYGIICLLGDTIGRSLHTDEVRSDRGGSHADEEQEDDVSE